MTLVYVTHHMEEIIPLFTHVALVHNGANNVRRVPKKKFLTRNHLAPATIGQLKWIG